jgi:phosphoenolpyruvate-protein kinase (PTS system EI component)
VFIRTERELNVIANIIRETGKKFGALPAEIGIMVEVPSNALLIEKLGAILKKLEKDGA